MKLSQYCQEVKPYVEASIKQIKQQGYIVSYFNNIKYTNVVDFLDDCVLVICRDIDNGMLEKDVDIASALHLAGIVEGYLTYTNITSKVVASRNPLGFLKK